MLTRIKEKVESLFSSQIGEKFYLEAVSNLNKQTAGALTQGIALGFSGGADSTLLLCFLYEYRRREGKDIRLLSVHVNHGIRDSEADRDETFATGFAQALDIEHLSVKACVPDIAKKRGLGLEEAARNVRYDIFKDIISGRNDISYFALAHNSTDNLETVLINLMRGSGIVGMCGIPPARDFYVRPLLSFSGSFIRELLDSFDIPYVFDSSNDNQDYTRNYVRHTLVPALLRLNPNPESAAYRMTENLRQNLDFVNVYINRILSDIGNKEPFELSYLRGLHSAVFAGVISSLIKERVGVSPDERHIKGIEALINEESFSISLSGGYDFVCQKGKCFFVNKSKSEDSRIYKLTFGENNIEGYDALVYIGEKFDNSSSNIYNSSIQVVLPRGIIDDGLYLRFKNDGDSYKFKGITHKLKKVFNDYDIPPLLRGRIPIFCDSEGIIWVPGLPLRDGVINEGDALCLTLLYNSSGSNEKIYTVPKKVGRGKTNTKGLEDT